MRTYKLLILGGGHVALGLAMAQRDCLICEESEFVDAGFSLTLKGFAREKQIALSQPAQQLQVTYEKIGLLSEKSYHCSALEIGASRFVLDNQIPVLLKCRVLAVQKREEGYEVTLITNSGLETVKADFIADTRPKGSPRSLSALFTIKDDESIIRVRQLFPEGVVEPSFCKEWGAVHMPLTSELQYNAALESLLGRWNLEEKLSLVAPRLSYGADQATPTDAAYGDPFSAFEAGYRWGREAFL